MLTVTEAIEAFRAAAKEAKTRTVEEHLERKSMVDYKTAMKMEFKYIRHDYPLNAYL